MRPERWQKIEQLYHAALECEQSQRAAYLHEVCAGDDALRREVESLLAQESRAGRLLETPSLEVVARGLAELQSPSSLLGKQLGSHKIHSLLGAGGIGEVYQARDFKLGRDVAIKVLPQTFLDDPERLARLQREARMLAALNHPNIATIYGLEQAEGVHYLMMELVPGQTLAERVNAGALKIEEGLKLGGQIADALEAAHEKGVIHRDLKPANVKVTPEGRVKVLDFGLAKAFACDGELDLSNAPTLTAMGTEEGRILGTPAYMSPEQARGKAVDKRTDIWAFGCVLYEMLTGKEAFRGETVSDTIAAVLEREPDWRGLPAATPAKIRDLLRRCMHKDTQHRMRDIGDARIEIEEALATSATTEPSAPAKGIRVRWPGILVWGAASLILATVTSMAVWNLKPSSAPPSQPITRTAITLPPGQELAGLESGPAVAISPDGTRLTYVARQNGNQQLYLRPMDSQEAKPIPGTEGAVNPFFSPDGQWVGFFAGGNLKKVPVSGGAALTLAIVALPRGASWGSQGIIAFAPTTDGALQQVPEAGGTPQLLTRLEKRDNSQRWPEFLPGGQAILFAASATTSSWVNAQVAVQSLGTGGRLDLIQGGTNPRYAPSGYLVYAQGGSLMAVSVDPQRFSVKGPPVPVVERVLQSTVSGVAQYNFSSTGSLVYIPGGLRRPKADWCGSAAMGQRSPWPPLRALTGDRGFPPTAAA